METEREFRSAQMINYCQVIKLTNRPSDSEYLPVHVYDNKQGYKELFLITGTY